MRATDKTTAEIEVLSAFNGLVEASKSLNSDKYFEYFDKEKFTGLNSDGTVWHSISGLEAMIPSGFSMVEKIITLEFKNVKVTVLNQTTAILVNEYTQSMLLKSGDEVTQSGGGTQVWFKQSSVWKLVSVSASDVSH
ncbi:MAG: nuclear transport factor 2 family protein [Colwellia sp.]|nr:nuclear transport factor 2 family protein [Colwellia sp.]